MCRRLAGNQRAAPLLVDVMGLSAAEIAAMVDISMTLVNSALARARRNASLLPTVDRWTPMPGKCEW
jgi:RNA polymerase sigma-70 factor (ECF subfamily)